MSYAGRLARLRVRLSGGRMLTDSAGSEGRVHVYTCGHWAESPCTRGEGS
jgi:hypothetical protein